MVMLSDLLAAPVDSARVVGELYGASLLATVPLLGALAAGVLFRRSSAGARTIVWRCSIVGLLLVVAGRLLPVHWMAGVLPEPLTWPLVTLGRTQLESASAGGSRLAGPWTSGAVDAFLILYLAGVIVVLLPTLLARYRLARTHRGSVPLDTPRWRSRLRAAASSVGVPAGSVRLVASAHADIPMTWGVLHPVIMLPDGALAWPAARIQAVLRHELVHVRGHDATMLLTARLACAIFWFHPGAWWLVRRFESDAEEACDDRVLLSGIRASDYAEWLAASAPPGVEPGVVAMALARRRGLRGRLRAVTDIRRHRAIPSRGAVLCAAMITAFVVAPVATARLAPTRAALTSLMRDARWESRAWAVVRLAQRPDSVDMARAAAHLDPDPAVRAWARYALARGAAVADAPSSR